jgi:hypothetical protein
MPEQDFTNREIALMFNEIKLELGHIKEQTIKTNGRLLKAEDKLQSFDDFKTKAMVVWGGAVTVIGVVINKML